MRIHRHITANSELLKSFPFKRELSMEAYLIENEGVLSLDDDVFSDVSIVVDELTLKQGRQSKDTDGRIDLLALYSQEYLAVIELKLGQLNFTHLQQLEDYLLQKEQILEQFPNIFDSAEIEPKWIGVLVGDSIDPELQRKISEGYTFNDIKIAALVINRFCGERGNIYVSTDTYFKTNTKDTTKYRYKGKDFGKGRLVLEVIKDFIQDHPTFSYADLVKEFPKNLQGSLGVFDTEDKAFEIAERDRKRHFVSPDELIMLDDSTIAVCSQWGRDNINKFIEAAKSKGFKIE